MQSFHFIWILLAILFGEREAPQKQLEDLRPYISSKAAIYLYCNIGKVRQENGLRKKILQEIKKHDKSYSMRGMIKELAEKVRVPSKTIQTLLEVNGVALGIYSIGSQQQLKGLLLFDRGDKPNVLSQLFSNFTHSKKYHRAIYKDVVIHSFMDNRFEGVWIAENKGKVAITLDPMTIREFILRAKVIEGKEKKLLKRSAFHIEVKGKKALSSIYNLLGRYDQEKYSQLGMLFDFASLENLIIDFSFDGLFAELKLHAQSPLHKILEPSEQPAQLLKYATEKTPLALALRFKNAPLIWQHFYKSMQVIESMEGRPGTIKRDVKELGIDFEKAFINNIEELTIMATKFKNLKRNIFFIFQLKTTKGLKERIRKFMIIADRGREPDIIEKENLKIWKAPVLGIALYHNNLVFGGSDIQSFISLLEKNKTSPYAAHLYKKYPTAKSFLSLALPHVNIKNITFGLQKTKTGLRIKANYDIRSFLFHLFR